MGISVWVAISLLLDGSPNGVASGSSDAYPTFLSTLKKLQIHFQGNIHQNNESLSFVFPLFKAVHLTIDTIISSSVSDKAWFLDISWWRYGAHKAESNIKKSIYWLSSDMCVMLADYIHYKRLISYINLCSNNQQPYSPRRPVRNAITFTIVWRKIRTYTSIPTTNIIDWKLFSILSTLSSKQNVLQSSELG